MEKKCFLIRIAVIMIITLIRTPYENFACLESVEKFNMYTA